MLRKVSDYYEEVYEVLMWKELLEYEFMIGLVLIIVPF